MKLQHRVPFGPRLSVEKHLLDNGLAVILLRDPSAPVIAYHTWFRVGSRHEREGLTGIAHLFEHLMFNQTEHLEAGEFDRLMEAAGGETNAATWVDWTFYRDILPAERLELAIRLEADRMQHLTLTDAQVESEREVVANERRFRVDDDVEGFLSEELFRLAYERHTYRHPTIGWMRDIMAITTEDARAFYRTFYAPNNATVIVVGDFEPTDTLARIAAAYGAIPAAELPAEAIPREPPQRAERRARFAKPTAADRVLLAWKAPPQGHADWLPLLAVHEALLGGPSSRLYRELVIEREVASSVQGMLSPFRDPGLLEVFVGMKRGHAAAEAEEIIDAVVDRVRREVLPADELAKVKNRLETDFWSELETADGKAEALGHYETTLGDLRQLLEIPRAIEALTPEDLLRAAAAYLVPTGRTVVIAEPSGEEPLDDDEDAPFGPVDGEEVSS